MLRPALTVAAAVACGGDPAVSAGAGAAVELLHNFTLIHDDVIDADDARRGRPTVWRVWGVNDAMLLGDALHALSFRFLVQGGIPKVEGLVARLVDTAVELCRGQSEDCRFETCASVGLVEYVAMAMGKTGSLMGCACALGALCAEADSATVAALDRFGRQLGLAFQFVDDALGIWGDPAVTGKPVGSDLARRKRSLPVVAALVSDTDAGRELAELYASEVPLGSAEVLRASELIAAAGGRELALGYADRHAAAAVMALPRSLATDDLTRLAYHVAHRDR
jgi:geranylgeranyl diphosphate synthase type I